jgi:L-iditol 2-dehydrogenase
MLAWLLHGKERLSLERIPVPQPQAGELLVRVEAALTCGTDLKVFLRGYHERMITPPSTFGHEFAGEVVTSKNPRFPPGTRIVAANSAPCRNCHFCLLGKPNLCTNLLFANGAYAEYMLVPARIVEQNCLVLPDGLAASKAALVEPLACAVKGIEDVNLSSGENVLVIGAGPMGLMLARLAVLAGAQVTCVAGQAERLGIARDLGASRTLTARVTPDLVKWLRSEYSPHGLGFDCVIEAVGKPETWHHAVELVRPGGRVNLFGGCPQGTELRLDASRLHYQEIRICASFHHTPESVRRALDLIVSTRVPACTLIGQGRSLLDLPEVLQEMRQGSAPPKTAILPGLAAGTRLAPELLEMPWTGVSRGALSL